MTAPTAAEQPDVYELLDQLHGANVVDPYPRYARLRERGGVHEGTPYELLGYEVPNLGIYTESSKVRTFTVVGYDAAATVLRNGMLFSNRAYEATMGRFNGKSILSMDDPEHRRYRMVLQRAFGKVAMEHWEAEVARPVIDRHIDTFAGEGRAELVRDFTLWFPNQVIGLILGLEPDELPWLHEKGVELLCWDLDPQASLAASQAMGERFKRTLDARRAHPTGDLATALVEGAPEGGLDEEDILSFMKLLLHAGGETTFRLASNLLFALLTHTDQLDAVRADRSLVPQAVEEALRWETSVQMILRVSTSDTEVDGVEIPAGSAIVVCLGAANHDPTRWDEPERFDIFRPAVPHLAFALGPHSCLGMHLARMETAVALEGLLDRLPNLRLDPEASDVHVRGLSLRSPAKLPVLFDV